MLEVPSVKLKPRTNHRVDKNLIASFDWIWKSMPGKSGAVVKSMLGTLTPSGLYSYILMYLCT